MKTGELGGLFFSTRLCLGTVVCRQWQRSTTQIFAEAFVEAGFDGSVREVPIHGKWRVPGDERKGYAAWALLVGPGGAKSAESKTERGGPQKLFAHRAIAGELSGLWLPELMRADLMRSRLSCTAVSGTPAIAKSRAEPEAYISTSTPLEVSSNRVILV